jgi:hypothetical protein
MTNFKFLLTAYLQYNFYIRTSWLTSSHFAKYFCDIYSEYITSGVVMTYAKSNGTRVMPMWLRTLRSWSTVWSD